MFTADVTNNTRYPFVETISWVVIAPGQTVSVSVPSFDALTANIEQWNDIYGFEGITAVQTGGETESTGGWTPILALVADGARYVMQVVDWMYGSGEKPDTGVYIGASGFVVDIADGVNVRGASGDAGAAGLQGDPGPAGADGAPGADGAQGDPGPIGPDGLSAYEVAVANGFVGDEAAWLASLVGETGPQGDPGPAGADGEPGADGAQGDPGPAGIDGADGDPGAPGADGLSAYDVAVANGFVGDEAAWLASLVGETGPQGDPGPAGADGEPGADGAQGDPGPAGIDGADGDPGAPGADGLSAYDVAVANGFVGDEAAWLASLVGETGPQGDPGPAGADGEPGADGAQGDPGPAGIDGADGDPGAPGADGLSAYEVAVANGFVGDEAAWLASLVGDTGPTGATGATGAPGTAATIAVGTVTTGAAGSSASITNVGTSSAAIFDFTIPRGDTGSSGGGTVQINSITGAYLVYAADRGTILNCTANTFTVSLTTASTLGSGFHCWVWNTSNTSSHVITIDPNGSETIDGATTLLLRRGEGCQIVCDGSNWQTGGLKKYRLYSENAANNATRPVASGGNGVAIGNASIASGANGVAIGNASQATTTSAVAIGDGAAASGISAIAIGTARAATQDSVAIAITDSTSTYGAKTSTNAIAIGQQNIASGAGSVVIGGILNSSAASYAAVIGGDNAQMSILASNSAIVGGTLANSSAGYGVILGGNALIQNVKGKVVSGTGSYARISNGEAQTGTTTLMGVTTSATPVVLTADKSSASTSNQLLLTDKQSMVFRGKVVAKRKGSESATSSAGWEFSGVIRRGANAASTALVAAVTPTLIAADTDAAAWTIAVTADTTNGALAVTVTGEASKSILWVCTLHSTEALYN